MTSENVFITSSQRQHWMFSSEEEIQQVKEGTNLEVREHFNEVFLMPRIQAIPNLDVEKLKNNILTPKEEETIVLATLHNITQICTKLSTSRSVLATSLVYFKRFFLYHSIMEYDVTYMMLASIFLAHKSEEKIMNYNTFLNQMTNILGKSFAEKNIDIRILVQYERLLLNGIKFHLAVFHPYRSFDALFSDFQVFLKTKALFVPKLSENNTSRLVSQKMLQKLLEISKRLAKDSLKSDAMFLYSPGLIAYSCLWAVANDRKNFVEEKNTAQQMAAEKLKKENPALAMQQQQQNTENPEKRFPLVMHLEDFIKSKEKELVGSGNLDGFFAQVRKIVTIYLDEKTSIFSSQNFQNFLKSDVNFSKASEKLKVLKAMVGPIEEVLLDEQRKKKELAQQKKKEAARLKEKEDPLSL